jgi:transposase InsO family protein
VKFAFIEAEKAIPVEVQCRVLGVSRSGFYAWLKRPESAHAKQDRRLGVLCREAHERSRRTYGSPRIHRSLKKQGVPVSRKRVARLMKVEGIEGKRRRRWTRTTKSEASVVAAPNILNRDFSPPAPNKSWVGDVTFLRTPFGFVYLAVVLDLFSRFVVGWAVSAENDRNLALAALHSAIRRRCPAIGLRRRRSKSPAVLAMSPISSPG